MHIIAAALLASIAIAAPAQAAELSFMARTTAVAQDIYISSSGKLTIDEASGVNGRYAVTGVSGNFISGILQADNTLRYRSDGPLTAARSYSFISFAGDGSVLDYELGFSIAEGAFTLQLASLRGNPHLAITGLGFRQGAIAIEGFIPPPVAPPPAPPPIFQPGAVPEPATWAMMISGFGLVGFMMRRRKATFGQAV